MKYGIKTDEKGEILAVEAIRFKLENILNKYGQIKDVEKVYSFPNDLEEINEDQYDELLQVDRRFCKWIAGKLVYDSKEVLASKNKELDVIKAKLEKEKLIKKIAEYAEYFELSSKGKELLGK